MVDDFKGDHAITIFIVNCANFPKYCVGLIFFAHSFCIEQSSYLGACIIVLFNFELSFFDDMPVVNDS